MMTPIMITMTQMLMLMKNGSKKEMDGTKYVQHLKDFFLFFKKGHETS